MVELKIDATLYLREVKDEKIEELIERIYMLVDPYLELQIYEETAELRSI